MYFLIIGQVVFDWFLKEFINCCKQVKLEKSTKLLMSAFGQKRKQSDHRGAGAYPITRLLDYILGGDDPGVKPWSPAHQLSPIWECSAR